MKESLLGKKNDSGKTEWSLLPFDSLRPVVEVLMHGRDKYGRNNWQHVVSGRVRYADAMLRHFTAWMEGEKKDA